jgi:hypothetical protein
MDRKFLAALAVIGALAANTGFQSNAVAMTIAPREAGLSAIQTLALRRSARLLNGTRAFLIALLVIAYIGAPSRSFAFMICTEPSEPSCVSMYGKFDSEWEFTSCKSDVQSYISELSDWVECLQKDVNQKSAEAKEKADEIVKQFNCKANGEQFCP